MCIFLFLVPPSFINVPPTNTSVVTGQNITLNCSAQGVSTPELTWYRNGVPIINSTQTLINVNELGNGVIISTLELNGNMTTIPSSWYNYFGDANASLSATYTCSFVNDLAERIVINASSHVALLSKYCVCHLV